MECREGMDEEIMVKPIVKDTFFLGQKQSEEVEVCPGEQCMEPYECWYYGIVTERVRNSQDAGNGYVTQKGHAITIRLNNRNMSDNKRQTVIRPSVLVSPGLRFSF